ncbi:lysophospholipase L1-like esterase [Methanococcus voltae]|uniref:Lysophospholipase L1-like esterase n=1 Tax=Methanococcus voltae TaxID=2188 RepID=A0A8J7S4U2_METVO|nr:SGNH/GDSL hydrolase family protein [Methanococcus voltae]MBP2201423.1 lysophospholipase L1-like esterase [Methanococcus voltae]
MKIITILGDSISMVRPNEGISLRELYSYKLQENLGSEYYVVNNAIRGSYAKVQLNNMEDTVLCNNSEVVIIFFGIVDCFPRLFSRTEKLIMAGLSKFKLDCINKAIIHIKSKNRYFFTKSQKKVYTRVYDFDKIYSDIILKIEKTGCKQIILVNIPSTNEKTKKRNYGVDENIREYNLIISKQLENKKIDLVDLYTITENNPNIILEDGHHISKEGHKILSEILSEKIKIK